MNPDISQLSKFIATILDCMTQTLGPITCLLIICTIYKNRKLWTLVNCIVFAETVVSLVLNTVWPGNHIIHMWLNSYPECLRRILGLIAMAILCLKLGFYFSIAAARYSIFCGNVSAVNRPNTVTVFIVLAVVYGGVMLLLPIYFSFNVCKLLSNPICEKLARYWVISIILGSVLTVAFFYFKITKRIKVSVRVQRLYGAKIALRKRKDIVTTVSSILQLSLTLATFIPYPIYFLLGYTSLDTTPGVLLLSLTIFIAATLDPVLYLAFSSDFRRSLLELLKSSTRKVRSSPNTGNSIIGISKIT